MPAPFDANAAVRFASLALACVHREYHNKIARPLNITERRCQLPATSSTYGEAPQRVL